MMSINNLSEKAIVRIWQCQLLERDGLATADGEPLRIIYPGRLNDDRGADFQAAVIVKGGRLLRGDVEIHVNSSGWHEHGHDMDAVYNRVVLHVVMWHDKGTATRLQNGREVPVLALERYVTIPVSQCPDSVSSSAVLNLPCISVALLLSTNQVAEILDRQGEERFLVKAAGFKKDIARMEASQTLYEGIMGALGYSRNKLPFLELARLLPLRCLESVTAGDVAEADGAGSQTVGEVSDANNRVSDAEWLARRQALLLGTSGLLFPQRQGGCSGNVVDERTDQLVRLRASSRHNKAMSPDDWHLLRVRPNNSPAIRLVAMSCLLLRYREKGWLEGLVGLVREAPLSKGGYKSLEAGLEVNIDNPLARCAGYQTAGRVSRLTLLGRGRAADIIVNVLLPFTFAWSKSAEPELGGKALGLYCCYPKLIVNSVERHMIEQLGLDSSLISSARRQQGLMHIYKNLCTLGRCKHCPLAKKTQRDAIRK